MAYEGSFCWYAAVCAVVLPQLTASAQQMSTLGSKSSGQNELPAALDGCTLVGAGRLHTFSLQRGGSGVAWGADSEGQCGVPAGLGQFTSMPTGDNHMLAISPDGEATACGATAAPTESVSSTDHWTQSIEAPEARSVTSVAISEPDGGPPGSDGSGSGSTLAYHYDLTKDPEFVKLPQPTQERLRKVFEGISQEWDVQNLRQAIADIEANFSGMSAENQQVASLTLRRLRMRLQLLGAKIPSASDTTTHQPQEFTVMQIYETCAGSVARVEAWTADGESVVVGTAFVAAPFDSAPGERYLVTARHVIFGKTRAVAVFGSQRFAIMGVVAEDPDADLAVVSVSGLAATIKPLPLRGSLPSIGQSVVCIGSAAGLSGSVSDGIVAAVRTLEDTGEVIQYTAPTSPGNSGSPLMSRNGAVLGVVSFGLPRAQSVNFAVPSNRLMQLKAQSVVPLTDWSRKAAGTSLATSENIASPPAGEPSLATKLVAEAIAAAIMVGVTDGAAQEDGALILAELARARMRVGDAEGAADVLNPAISLRKKSWQFMLQAATLYAQLGDVQSLALLITSCQGKGPVYDAHIYAAALTELASNKSVGQPQVVEIAKQMKHRVDRVSRPVFDTKKQAYDVGLADFSMSMTHLIKAMIAISDDESAKTALDEVRSLSKSDLGTVEYESLLDVSAHYHEARCRRLLASCDIEGAEREIAAIRALAVSARQRTKERSEQESSIANEWSDRADACLCDALLTARQCGQAGHAARLRASVASAIASRAGSDMTRRFVETLLAIGDVPMAEQVSQGEPAALLPLTCHYASVGMFEKALKAERFLHEHERPLASVRIARAALEAGEREVFENMVSLVEVALARASATGAGIYEQRGGLSGVAVEYGALLARSTTVGEWERVNRRVMRDFGMSVHGLCLVGMLIELHHAEPNPAERRAGDDGAVDSRSLVNVPSWADLLAAEPDPAVVISDSLRSAIKATGFAWRVRDKSTQIEFVLIPPGTFQMGCSESIQFECKSWETPVHTVTLARPFYMGRYEVTQAQWTAQMGSNPSYFQSPSTQVPASEVPNRPVEMVSWNTIQRFLRATGMRLPTEAEWEYSYRAGTITAFHSLPGYPNGTNDDNQLGAIAWFSSNATDQTHPVGQKAGNGFGLHDMSGNVFEWVNDWYSGSYYTASPSMNPPGPGTGTVRVLRGGSWYLTSGYCRSSSRINGNPSYDNDSGGFRVARNP